MMCPAAEMLRAAVLERSVAPRTGISPERMHAIVARGWSIDAMTGREMIHLADALKVDLRDLADAARGLR